MTLKKERKVPVFVFLDEGVPDIRAEIARWTECPPGFSVKIIPFPDVMKSLGIFDFQVVLFMKRKIFSLRSRVSRFLNHYPAPIFFFFTSDYNFLEDARNGFAKTQKPKRSKEGIKFKDPDLVFESKTRSMVVHVEHCQPCGRRQEVKHMLETLIKFLSNYHPDF